MSSEFGSHLSARTENSRQRDQRILCEINRERYLDATNESAIGNVSNK